MVQCYLCSFASHFKKVLAGHMTKEHKENVLKLFKCEICKYTTKRKANYKSHNETVHQGLRRKTECDVCGSRFVSYGDLKKHRKEIHTSLCVFR